MNGVSILCEPEKTTDPSDQSVPYIPETQPGDEFTESQIMEARDVLAKVMEADEVKKVSEKKKKKKMMIITITSVLGAIILASALGLGGYFYHKKKVRGSDEEGDGADGKDKKKDKRLSGGDSDGQGENDGHGGDDDGQPSDDIWSIPGMKFPKGFPNMER